MKKQILCWNARGIVNQATCDYLSLLIRNHNLGICCILEPKADPEELATLARKMGFQAYLNCHPINSHIWLMWTEDFKISTLACSDQHISVEVHNKVEDIKMVCSFIYAFIDIRLRQQLWEDIEDFSLQIDSPWLLMGDFNSIASWSEKKGGNKKMVNPLDSLLILWPRWGFLMLDMKETRSLGLIIKRGLAESGKG
ncbi:hypothetical protein QQ045_001704 [Rhodiola kirilowii]